MEPNQVTSPDARGAIAPQSAEDLQKVKEQAIAAERARVAEIEAISKRHGFDEAFRTRMIEKGASIEEVRSAALDELAKRSENTPIQNRVSVDVTRDERQTVREGAAEALLHRYAPEKYKLTEKGRDFRSMRLERLAEEILLRSGVKTRGMDRFEIIARSLHGTSDFPLILADVANKTLRDAYQAAPRTFLNWCRRGSLSDFKPATRTALGDAPKLEKIGPNGEYTYGTIGEAGEKIQLASYGKIVGVTRQAIVNDDLDAFTRVPEMFARRAAELEGDLVYSPLTSNATMGDNVALFHADHGNIATSAVMSVAALSNMSSLMRRQKGINGARIQPTPRFVLVPTNLDAVARQFLTVTGQVPSAPANANPYLGVYAPVSDPRLDDSSTQVYYLVADPASCDTIEYAYLEGQEGVYLEQRVGFERDGVEFKARHDFATKVIDWRGFVRNAGA